MARGKKGQAKPKGAKLYKTFGRVSTIAAGVAAGRAVNLTWKAATGKTPPSSPESPDVDGREAFIWAAISGAAMQSAKLIASRKAVSYWMRSTGEMPPGLTSEAKVELAKDLSSREKRQMARARRGK